MKSRSIIISLCFQIDSRTKATKLSPTVEIRIRNKSILSMSGDAKYVTGERIDGDLVLDSSLLNSPIALKGELNNNLISCDGCNYRKMSFPSRT